METCLVIFDLDGTLYETHIVLEDVIRKAASEIPNVEIDFRAIADAIGAPAQEFFQRIAPSLDLETRQLLTTRTESYERELIPMKGKPYPGVAKLLADLSDNGHRLAVCSNGSREYIDLVLKACSLKNYISYISGRSEDSPKEDRIRDLIRDTNPQWAMVVGDRGNDFQAAKANNLPSIGVSYGYGGSEVQQADLVASDAATIGNLVHQCSVFNHILHAITPMKPDRALVIGVNGIDTSGKTIFAESLSKYLMGIGQAVQLIHLDDFHNPRSVRQTGKSPVDAYIQNAFDLDLLMSKLLHPARRGQIVRESIDQIDLSSDERKNRNYYYIDKSTIVIVEGVLLYREPLDQFFDYRLFLDISFDEMLRRAESRDVPLYGHKFMAKYTEKYIPIQKWYLETCDPIGRSDLVLDNTNFCRPAIL